MVRGPIENVTRARRRGVAGTSPAPTRFQERIPKLQCANQSDKLCRFDVCLPPVFPVQFVDVTPQSKIAFRHENGASPDKLVVETFGSGVAWIDYDNDGLLDLYFANGANLGAGKRSPGNVLLRNTGTGTFVDVTSSAGVQGNGGFGTGVAVGDYDNDGFLDLYITGYGSNILYHNNGNGTFTDVTAKAGVKGGGWSSSAVFSTLIGMESWTCMSSGIWITT